MRSPVILIVGGKPGSGKGTQSEFLQKDFGFFHITSGGLIRARMETKDFTGRKIKEISEKGHLLPSSIVIKQWVDEIERINEEDGYGVIFDGMPRMILEAELLDQALAWYEWADVRYLELKVSDKEITTRLLKRGRYDDGEEEIANRLKAHEKEVVPVTEHYRAKDMVFEVNGEQSREDVYKEIREALKI